MDFSGKQAEISDYLTIIVRQCFSFVTIILGAVVAVLFWLGEHQDAVFIASVLILNITIGLVQEVRARRQLDKLKALTAPTARLLDQTGGEQLVPIENLRVGDVVRLKAGDQLPGDGKLTQATALELNEAFLTGESVPIGKIVGADAYAASFVTAGSGELKIDKLGEQTRIGALAASVKRLNFRATPIQRTIGIIITVLSWLFVVMALVLVARGSSAGEAPATLAREVAAIAATIVPEGLVLAVTLLFTYGAVQLYRSRLLVQRTSAVESLARIQILCLDKTGTLTEDRLVVNSIVPVAKTQTATVEKYLGHYLALTDPDSDLAAALIRHMGKLPAAQGESLVGFSSERKWGAVRIGLRQIVVGAPDILADFATKTDAQWVLAQNQQAAQAGNRVLLIAEASLDGKVALRHLKPVGIVRFEQPIKASAADVVKFFHQRDVRLVVISGDQAPTVLAIARQLQLADTDTKAIDGKQLAKFSAHQRAACVAEHSIFARVTPQQKAQLVRDFRQLGYTAMTGDGANDALALKAADVGISMFAAADITRRVADIVLVKNAFTDIPDGVGAADRIITNIELVGSVFLHKVTIGLTLIGVALATGTGYVFSPRTITILNYFLIGLPLFLWVLSPRLRERQPHEPGYWAQITPLLVSNGLVAMMVSVGASLWALGQGIDIGMVVFLTTLILGVNMVFLAPYALRVEPDQHPRRTYGVVGAMLVGLGLVLLIEPLRAFFGLQAFDWSWFGVGFVWGSIGVALAWSVQWWRLRLRP